jgi:DNA-binding CsgD family transcriptional regulator
MNGDIMLTEDRCCCADDHVTGRELRVIELVATGYTNAQIARHIGLSQHTVASQVTAAMRRIGAGNRAELVARSYAVSLLTAGTWPPVASGRRCLGTRPWSILPG